MMSEYVQCANCGAAYSGPKALKEAGAPPKEAWPLTLEGDQALFESQVEERMLQICPRCGNRTLKYQPR